MRLEVLCKNIIRKISQEAALLLVATWQYSFVRLRTNSACNAKFIIVLDFYQQPQLIDLLNTYSTTSE